MPEMSSSKYKEPAAEKAPQHKHPSGVRDQAVGFDDQGRRVIREVQARVPTYIFSCKGCIAEDKARMSAPTTLTEEQIEKTLFLIPEGDYDQQVVREYLKIRYPEAQNVVAMFHAERLSYIKGAQIVVVTRRGKNGGHPGPSWRRQKDVEDVWKETKIPPETYLDEVVESAPVVVAQCMDVSPANMFSDQQVDMSELVVRLTELAMPYRIAVPADPRDRMYVMRANT